MTAHNDDRSEFYRMQGVFAVFAVVLTVAQIALGIAPIAGRL